MDRESKQAAKDLRAMYRELGTWTDVAGRLGLNVGQVWNTAKGRKRASAKVLVALGYPTRKVLAPVCPECGVVHVKNCPKVRRPRVKRAFVDWPRRRLVQALEKTGARYRELLAALEQQETQ